MSGGSVLAIEAVDGVQILTINRPEKRNALNAAVRTAVSEALAESAADPAVRVVVFTGAGVSAESGLGTFRGPGGLWESFRPEELALKVRGVLDGSPAQR